MLNYITKKGASSAQRLGIVGTLPFYTLPSNDNKYIKS